MKTGAIFDLDGTLVNTASLHLNAWTKLFKRYNIDLTDEELVWQAGKKNILFIEIILKNKERLELDINALSQEKDEIVIEELKKNPVKVFPGVLELLTELTSKNIKIALATSASKQTALLLGKDVMHFFESTLFAEDVTLGKPNPELFLKSASRLGLTAVDCIVFEDATSGVQAAKNGEFFCVARNNNEDQELDGADVIVTEYNVEELMKLFDN